ERAWRLDGGDAPSHRQIPGAAAARPGGGPAPRSLGLQARRPSPEAAWPDRGPGNWLPSLGSRAGGAGGTQRPDRRSADLFTYIGHCIAAAEDYSNACIRVGPVDVGRNPRAESPAAQRTY